jgi:hypothetical protein
MRESDQHDRFVEIEYHLFRADMYSISAIRYLPWLLNIMAAALMDTNGQPYTIHGYFTRRIEQSFPFPNVHFGCCNFFISFYYNEDLFDIDFIADNQLKIITHFAAPTINFEFYLYAQLEVL